MHFVAIACVATARSRLGGVESEEDIVSLTTRPQIVRKKQLPFLQ